ncbi:hypothetical protein IW140_002757 [Coemansia sp. RSA 1813]|nr:hypothetical protein EV178_003637 [Coemansia sp. RSA 1646]KAJ1765862.1 hypothetical protein LPJ74_006168 [Coemansia sp. RSA 1843]KAJ2088379.1 hypothetical protein IW138_004255 [Coemansia sp. RSA 986]KAJ2569869.1 hypothetical protein IW140_002757 [Coemansia sp. RSA 1813]
MYIKGILALSLATLVSAKLDGCAKTFALAVTNIYENGDTAFHFDYCENLKDGRGYTSGIAGFCTGTGDAWEVIQLYHKLTGGNDDFTPMDSVLSKYAANSDSSTKGLKDYCKVWENLGNTDKKFRRAQALMRDKLYFDPSQEYGDKVGLKLSISQAQMYDAGIEHGTWPDKDGLPTLIEETSASFQNDTLGDSGSTLDINGHKVDEIVWLQKFMDVRQDHLLHPREPDNQSGGYWAQTLYRVRSYQFAIDQKEYMWTDSVKVLDNDGNPICIKCQTATCPAK